MKQFTPYVIALIVMVGVAGFFGGMKYQSGKQSVFNRQGFGGAQGVSGMRTGNGPAAGGRTGVNRPVNGEVLTSDDKSITVKLPDGSSKIVLITSTTQINKASEATKSDITAGIRVAVFGQTNPDGSVTAQNVQLNPTMGFGGNGAPRGPSNVQ